MGRGRWGSGIKLHTTLHKIEKMSVVSPKEWGVVSGNYGER